LPWLLVALVAFVCFISIVVIPREEQFLEENFPDSVFGIQSKIAAGYKSIRNQILPTSEDRLELDHRRFTLKIIGC
jgi:hypothetical protein